MGDDTTEGALGKHTENASTASGKGQLLAAMEVLGSKTDRGHGLTAKQIAEEVERACGKAPTEAKVLDDVHAIARARPFGMEIDIPRRGKAGGIRRTRGALTGAQARALANMARTCKFVSASQREELCEALGRLLSERERQEMVGSVLVDEREAPASSDAFHAADVASMAMKEGRMIRFEYAKRELDGTESFPGGTRCEVPVALVFSFGSYYLETLDPDSPEGGTLLRRLDKVRNPRVADRRKDDGTVASLRHGAARRTAARVDMWGNGPELTLFLRVRRDYAGYVCDRFGAGVRFEHVARDLSVGYACITAQVSPTLCRWLFGMGDGVVVAKPKSHLWASQFWTSSPEARKPFEDLLADYEAFSADMRRRLEKCAEHYQDRA